MLFPLLFTLLASCLVDLEVSSKTAVFFRVKSAKQRGDEKKTCLVLRYVCD